MSRPPFGGKVSTRVDSMQINVEIEREDDGRWIAEIPELPGVIAYGDDAEQARRGAMALALRVVADRLDHGEEIPAVFKDAFAA